MKDFIAVFDSGHGGLSVLAQIRKVLPNEHLKYFGDSLRAPYGQREKGEIVQFSKEIAKRFYDQGAKAMVIACNTATSAAANILREEYDIPIIGMEPALKPAVESHPNQKILVIATRYTIENDKYHRLERALSASHYVESMATPKLIEFVENGQLEEKQVFDYFSSLHLEGKKYRAVVLGCTHFLFLKDSISKYFKEAQIYDGNLGTALHLKNILEQKGLTSNHKDPATMIDNSAGDKQREVSIWLYQKMLEHLTLSE